MEEHITHEVFPNVMSINDNYWQKFSSQSVWEQFLFKKIFLTYLKKKKKENLCARS